MDEQKSTANERRLPSWREMNRDTSLDVEAIQFAFYQEAPVWRKLKMMTQLHQMARTMAMSGLRRRHPEATEAQLRRYLADMLLGPELAARMYEAIDRAEWEKNG